MRKRTKYILPKGTELTGEVLAQVIKDNQSNLLIYRRLESYAHDEPIMDRETPNELLAINNFADYITNINTGYLVGTPVDYHSAEDTNLDSIVENYNAQSIAELDSEIETDCSMFGQAFENVYIDEETAVRSAKLSVYNTIVLYDDTFKHNKVAAVYYAPQIDKNGRALTDKYDLTIWTPTMTLNRKLVGSTLTIDPENPDTPHYFKEVPVIHYLNNSRLRGDYEPVITLIDAYNILQSDRVIDREKLVDAILAFYGAKLTAEDAKAIKENRTIGLPEGAKAEYLIKSIDEADADVLRKTIAADIHKFSMTPDLSDESFGNSPSGVSIMYKLLAFEQNIKRKERQFEIALRTRLRLYINVLQTAGKLTPISDKDVDIVFRRALPKNDYETSQMINNLSGTVDDETLVGQLSFVKDASKVVEKVKEQTPQLGNFGTDEAEA